MYVGGGLNCAKVYSNDLLSFFGVRAFTARNFAKCTFLLQSWQPTITFHNLLRGCKDNFWQIIAEIDILPFLRGARA